MVYVNHPVTGKIVPKHTVMHLPPFNRRGRHGYVGPFRSVNAGVHPAQVAECNADPEFRKTGAYYEPGTGDLICPERNGRAQFLKVLKYRGEHNRDEVHGGRSR